MWWLLKIAFHLTLLNELPCSISCCGNCSQWKVLHFYLVVLLHEFYQYDELQRSTMRSFSEIQLQKQTKTHFHQHCSQFAKVWHHSPIWNLFHFKDPVVSLVYCKNHDGEITHTPVVNFRTFIVNTYNFSHFLLIFH